MTSPGNYIFNPASSAVTGGSAAIGNDYSITYNYTNIQGCSDEQSITIAVFASNANTACPGTVKDYRDDRLYPTFLSGTGANARCWMAANLNYGNYTNQSQLQTDNCMLEKYCKDNVEAHCAHSGGYYQWDEIMEYQEISTNQDLCPPGWHLPSSSDWDALILALEGNAIAGGFMKDPNIQDGFDALLEGIFYQNNTWSFGSDPVTTTMFWTSQSLTISHAVARGLSNFNYSVSYYPSFKANAFPVRCVRD
jgi:uncharacterized protein (TIGR02145 family)